MATSDENETKAQDADSAAAKDQSNTYTTTDRVQADQPSDTVETVHSDEDQRDQGTTSGAVVYGDPGLDDKDSVKPEGDGVLGTTRVGDKEVPWTYLNADHFEDEAKVRTSDSDDPARDWTSQTHDTEEGGEEGRAVALIPVQQEPGQTFVAEELPNVDSLKQAGIDPVQFLSGLPVRQGLDKDEEQRERNGAFG